MSGGHRHALRGRVNFILCWGKQRTVLTRVWHFREAGTDSGVPSGRTSRLILCHDTQYLLTYLGNNLHKYCFYNFCMDQTYAIMPDYSKAERLQQSSTVPSLETKLRQNPGLSLGNALTYLGKCCGTATNKEISRLPEVYFT